MFNKIYVFLKEILKQNYKGIIFLLCFLIVATYPVPYYIFTSGGITDLGERFEVENGYEQEGSYNLSYVTEIDGNILTYLAARVIPSWDLMEVSNYQTSSTETLEELSIRDRLSLLQANQTAVMVAYQKAGKNITINKTSLYIVYLLDYFKSTEKVKVGDLIYKVDDHEVESFDSLVEYIDGKNVGDTITFELIRNGESFKTDVMIQEIEGKKATGIAIYQIYDYVVDPSIEFSFSARETGSSAGFMTTLAIYDTLIEEDLTNGLKIAGSGTISMDGTVGEIGGVKYKLKGAVSAGADIFFAPSINNYDECIALKKEKNYDIEIVSISTLDDAILYLKNLKNEKE